MSDIVFNCPECDGHLRVDAAGAGKEVDCPHCNHPLVIPDPAAASAAEADTEPATEIVAPSLAGVGLSEKLHLKKSAEEIWEEQHSQHDNEDPEEVLRKLALAPDPTVEVEESPAAEDNHHVEQHGSDINVGQPWMKKHDQWFSDDHKHYHYCYYNPHQTKMATACGETMEVRSSEPAPSDLSKVKKRALCKKCEAALE